MRAQGACDEGDFSASSEGSSSSVPPTDPPPLTTAFVSWSSPGGASSMRELGVPMAPPRPDPTPGGASFSSSMCTFTDIAVSLSAHVEAVSHREQGATGATLFLLAGHDQVGLLVYPSWPIEPPIRRVNLRLAPTQGIRARWAIGSWVRAGQSASPTSKSLPAWSRSRRQRFCDRGLTPWAFYGRCKRIRRRSIVPTSGTRALVTRRAHASTRRPRIPPDSNQ